MSCFNSNNIGNHQYNEKYNKKYLVSHTIIKLYRIDSYYDGLRIKRKRGTAIYDIRGVGYSSK